MVIRIGLVGSEVILLYKIYRTLGPKKLRVFCYIHTLGHGDQEVSKTSGEGSIPSECAKARLV